MTDLCNKCRERPKISGLGWCCECFHALDPQLAERAGIPKPVMQEWTCWLPFPPSVNNLFTQGNVRGKTRRFPSRRYKTWRMEAVIRIRASWRSRPPWAVPVVVKLELVPPDARERDADNYAKPVLDALVVSQVLIDDSNKYVKAVAPFWAEPQRASGAIVTIRPAVLQQVQPSQLEMFA